MMNAPSQACMVCGVDLWDVERYVTAGSIVICVQCLAHVKQEADRTTRPGNTQVTVPPRVHGDAPDASAPLDVADAFRATFGRRGDRLGDYLDDAAELGPLLDLAASNYSPATEVEGVCFTIW